MESTQAASGTLPASELPRGSSADPGTIGRFVVLRRLGEGGMGVVYSAFDEQLGRRVAIKLLHQADDSDLARARVYHEAQALARLSHPNVVQVYEVGEHGDGLYVAMEFVTGETLRAWMNHGGHDWRDTVEVFVQAGQGLAAAHVAGLVHRDFKPENTVIGEDGRARVLDFGLALHQTLPDAAPTQVVATADTHAVGVVAGTPRYMSPEQHEGRPLDARSDQFSFCVALWEALHGEPPHAGDTLLELVHNAVTGTLRPPPGRTGAPEWLRGVLIRGLAVRPQDRWPDMPTLLAALRADPRVRRRRLAALALAVTTLAGLLALAMRREEPCAAVAESATEVWSPAIREAIEGAFQATGAPSAAASWTMLAGQVDAYVGEWSAAREALCVDHQAARRSDEFHDLGVECLDDRLSQLRSQLDALTGVDALAVEKATGIRSRLRPISGCADSRALRARPRPPEDPDRRTTAEALRTRIDALAARRELGQLAEAIPRAQALVAEARRIDDGPLLAEALHELGRCEEALASYTSAESTLQAAFFTAGRVYHDRITAAAAWRLCFINSQIRADVAASWLWLQHMEVAISRLGDPGELLAELHNARGNIHYREGRYKEALAQTERARDLLAEVDPDDEMSRARYIFNIGVMHKSLGEYAAAQRAYDEALALGRRQVGEQHPFVTMLTQNMGSLLL
ncbi:MAG TPA: serine/threonine-protein kinase, partial [Nannocystis sp.]